MNEQFIQEMSEVAGVDFRANVPAGTQLGEQEIEPGANVKWTKPSSMMRVGKTALPERIALYDLMTHDRSMVPPTIAQKRMATYPGRFTLKEPADWHAGDPEVIDETCEICIRQPEFLDGSLDRPAFTSWSQLRQHYQLFHTNEWVALEDDRRERERREEQGQMRALIASIASMVSGGVNVPPEVRAQVEQLQDSEEDKSVRVSRPRKASG